MGLNLNRSTKHFAPPPRLTISEWADQYCFLPDNNAEPGRWRTSRAPYQKGIMDALCDNRIQRITIMTSAQVGKTSMLNNAIGYYIHQNPKSIIIMQQQVKEALWVSYFVVFDSQLVEHYLISSMY